MRGPSRQRPRPVRLTLGPVALALVVAAGCALFRPEPLELPPGHAAVLGRIELIGFGLGDAAIDIVRDDGTFDSTLALVGQSRRDFALVLPRGRYRVTQLVAMRDVTGDVAVFPLRVTFDTGDERAVYIGTLRISGGLGMRVQVSVRDDYNETVRTVRRLYTDVPSPIVRRLMTAA